MRNLVFLFIFVFSPLAYNASGNVGSPEIDKCKELVINNDVTPKTVKDEVIEVLSDWQTAEASYYDSRDSKQTKGVCDGIGAFGRAIGSGSVALGSSFTENFREKNLVVFIQIKNCDIVTPYGKGIFRVDDMMAQRFNKKGDFHIDFSHEDISLKLKRKGRFQVEFRIYKIIKTVDSYS